MGLREMLGRELWWTPNMAVYGVGGAPLSPQEPLGWGYGRMLENVGRFSRVVLDSKWEMVLGLAFGMKCGAVIRLSK
jgi:hypothetical protein